MLSKHQGDGNPSAHETRHELDALARRSAASNGFAAAEVAMHDVNGEATPRATPHDRMAAAMRRSPKGPFAARAVKYLQRTCRRFISSTAIDS